MIRSGFEKFSEQHAETSRSAISLMILAEPARRA